MLILASFGLALLLGLVVVAGLTRPCFWGRHRLGRHGIACLRCGEWMTGRKQ